MDGVSRRVRDEDIGDGSQVREDPNVRRLLGRLESGEAVGVPLVSVFAPNFGQPSQNRYHAFKLAL